MAFPATQIVEFQKEVVTKISRLLAPPHLWIHRKTDSPEFTRAALAWAG